MPLNVARVVSLRTAKRGRSYRGRVYLSGTPDTVIETMNTIDATHAANLVSGFNALATLLDGHGFDVVVASKQHNGVETNPAEVNEVIAFAVDVLVDSQRRRLTGRGT